MIFVVLILTATQLLLNVYSNEILGSVLRKYVEIKTGKLYTLNFEECNLNFFGGEVTFNEIYLLPDPFEFNKRQNGKNPNADIVEIYFPYAKVNGSGIRAIIGSNSWLIDNLEISQPYIKYISYHPRPLVKKRRNWIGSIINLGVDNQVELLQIENGKIQDGKLHLVIHKQDTVQEVILNNINLDMTHLVADSLNSGSFYHALSIDDLIFSMDNNKIDLPESPYSINIDDMTFSSSEQDLIIKGLGLRRKEKVTDEPFGVEHLQLPELTLKSLDLEKLVTNREISVDEMILKKPESLLVMNSQVYRKKKKDAFKTLFKSINKVHVNIINIENALFSLDQRSTNRILNSIEFRDISMTLDNLLIDTMSYDKRKPRFFLDDFILHAGQQAVSLPHSNDEFKLDDIDISTIDKSFHVSDFRFSINTAHNNIEFVGDISTPEIAMEDFDIWKAIVNKEFDVGKLALKNMVADIQISDVIPEIDTTEINHDSIDSNPFNNLPKVDLDLLALDRARIKLKYQQGPNAHFLNIRNLNTNVSNIFLDQSTIDDSLRTPIYDHIDLALYDARYRKNDTSLYISCERITGRENLYTLDLNTLHYEDENGLFFDFTTAGISGFSLSDLYNNNHLIIGDLVVEQPAIKFNAGPEVSRENRNKGSISRLPVSIDILNTTLVDGHLEFQSYQEKHTAGSIDNFSACMKEFHIDSIPGDEESNRFSFYDLQLDGTNIQFQVQDSTHKLSISEFMVSVLDSSVSINDITLKSFLDFSDSVQAHINSININYVDLFNAVFSAEFIIPELILDNPDIRITRQDYQKSERLNHGDRNPGNISLPFNTIWLQSMDLKHGSIVWQDISEDHEQYFLLDKVDLFVHDVIMDSTSILNPEKLFLSANLNMASDQLVYQTPNESYTLKIEDLSISTFDSLFTGNNFHLLPRNYGNQITTLEVYSPRFAVVGLDIYSLADTRTLNTGEVFFQNPEVHYLGNNGSVDSPGQKSINEISLNPKSLFQEINISSISIPNGHITINNTGSAVSGSHIIDEVMIDVSNIHINSDTEYSSPFEYAESIDLVIHGMDIPLKSPYYSLNVGDVNFSSNSKSLSINDIALIPFTEKTEFGKHFEYQVSWINLVRSNLDITGIKLDEVLSGNFLADKIYISDANLDVYKDKNFPYDYNKAPLLPVTALKKVPFKIIIDSVEIENSNIHYSEFADQGHNPGTITFRELEALILNVTNDSIAIRENNHCLASINSMLMGTGVVDLNFEFDLSSDKDIHTVNGTLNQMNLEEMNDFMENVAFARITGGKNNVMNFNMDFNDRISTGIMKFNYDDLKVTFIDKKSSKTGVDEAMGAFVANTFILKKNNPRYLLLRNGNIYYYRDTKRSIFSYWARSFLSGIKSSVGLKVNQKKIDRKALSILKKKN